MSKAVLFDLDGTLLDTANDLGAALNYLLSKYNFALMPEERFRPVASDGAKGLLELGFGEHLPKFDFENLRQEFLDYYQANIAVHTCLYEGILPLLETLNDQQVQWGIITNKPIDLTLLLLPHFPIFKHCQVTIGGDSLPHRKPHPAPLLHAAQQINIQPSQCIYVGDAPRDIESGNSAGMSTGVASWGYIADIEECQHWQADVMLNEPLDIVALLEG